MHFFTALRDRIVTPFFGLLVVGVVINGLGAFYLFNQLNTTQSTSQAVITNSWSVWGNNAGGMYCDGSSGSTVSPRELGLSGDIVQISQGADHVLAIRNDTTLKVCGNNSQGQLGNGTTTNQSQFTNNTALSGIQFVIAADQISYALTSSGNVYQWGDTITGVLQTPTQISGLSGITQIAASEKSLLAMTGTGNVYVYGFNQYGELGNGTQTQITTPTIIDTGASDIECSKESCAIVKSGQVYTSGNNSAFELGTNSIPNRQLFGLVAGLINVVNISSSPSSSNYHTLQTDQTVWSWGDAPFLGYTLPGNIDSFTPTQLVGLTNVTKVSGGLPLALKTTGEVYTWTTNNPFQVAGLSNSSVMAVSSKDVAFVKADIFNPLINVDIAGLTASCNPAVVNTTTTCTFILPATKDLPSLFGMAVGNATPGGSCSLTITTVTCLNVPVDGVVGSLPIQAKIGSGPVLPTGEVVFVTATVLSGVNIGNQTGVCNPNPVQQTGMFDCNFPLVGSTVYSLPPGGLRAGALATPSNALSVIGASDPCTISGATLTCTNIPTLLSSNILTIGSHEVMVYEPLGSNYLDRATIGVQAQIIQGSNIQTSTDCTTSQVIVVPNTFTCTFALTGSPTNTFQLPIGGINALVQGSTSNTSCIIQNNTTPSVKLLCTGIPTAGFDEGTYNVDLIVGGYITRGSITLQNYLDSSDLSSISILCNEQYVNSNTSCTFTLPANTLLPLLTLGIGDAAPGGVCTDVGNSVTCTNVPTGSMKGNQSIYARINSQSPVNTGNQVLITKYLDNGEIEPIEVTCIDSLINTVTSCSFFLPAFEVLPAGFEIQIGLSSPSTSCSQSGQSVTCTGVSTGSDAGRQTIFMGTGSTVSTGDEVLISRNIENQDIATIVANSSFNCLPNPVAVYSTVTCTAQFPEYIVLTGNTLTVNLEGQPLATCTITNRNMLCVNVRVGGTSGNRNTLISLNGSPSVQTGYIVTVSTKIITDDQLANIGDPNEEQIIFEFSCGVNNVVFAGKKAKCTGSIQEGWVLPTSFRMGVGVEPDGACRQEGGRLTCISVPVQNEIGDDADLNILNSLGEEIVTGIVFKVEGAPANYNEETGTLFDAPTGGISSATKDSNVVNTETLLSSIDITPRTGGVGMWSGVSLLLGLVYGLGGRFMLKRSGSLRYD
jgi:alpha-tubulin suppressor-like RCC1 family protein